MLRLKDINDRIERSQPADRLANISDLGLVARCLMLARAEGCPPAAIAERLKAPADVIAVCKAAIGATNLTSFPPYAGMVATFLESLRSSSIFARLLADGMRKAPLQTAVRAVSVAVTGTIQSEGHPAPISRLVMASPQLPRLQAVALVALTKEVVTGTSASALAFIEAELRSAVSTAIDGPFLSIASAGAPSVVSTGTDADSALLDLRALLAVVNATGAGSLFWAVPPDVANRASTLSGLAGSLTFADMGPTGGMMLNVPALVSSQVPAGQLLLIDAAGLVGDLDAIDIVSAEHVALQLRDDPLNTAAELVSLWQTGAIAVRATAGFGLERFRANAVARLTGIGWGGGVPNS